MENVSVIKYIKNKINEIDKKLIGLLDHDEIMKLRQQKTAYTTYLEILEYQEKLKQKIG